MIAPAPGFETLLLQRAEELERSGMLGLRRTTRDAALAALFAVPETALLDLAVPAASARLFLVCQDQGWWAVGYQPGERGWWGRADATERLRFLRYLPPNLQFWASLLDLADNLTRVESWFARVRAAAQHGRRGSRRRCASPQEDAAVSVLRLWWDRERAAGVGVAAARLLVGLHPNPRLGVLFDDLQP